MKRPLAYITAAWYGGDTENVELLAMRRLTIQTVGYLLAPVQLLLFFHSCYQKLVSMAKNLEKMTAIRFGLYVLIIVEGAERPRGA